jgi:hypothetical protein
MYYYFLQLDIETYFNEIVTFKNRKHLQSVYIVCKLLFKPHKMYC